jgi:succinate dehydrogenase membrane anchor subunit
MVNRVVTGAHYGLRSWLVQRITAVMMAAYTIFLAVYVLLHPGMDYNAWTWLFSNDVMRSVSLLFLLAVFAHAWVGVRDIVMDYVKPAAVRLAIHVLVILMLALYSIWAVQILWEM